MAITGSKTKEYGEDVKREISEKLTQIMRCTERLEHKMNIMIALANALQNEDEKIEFIACTEMVKNDHDNLKKRFTDFADFQHFEEDYTVVFSQIEAFMKQELDKNDKLCQLSVKFLSEEDRNHLDFLIDEDDNFTGFPPLEPRPNEGLADRGTAKLLSREDGEESEKESERFLKKLEGSSSEAKEQEDEKMSKIRGLEEKLQSLMLPGASNQDEDGEASLKEWLNLHKNGNEDWNATNGPRGSAINLAANLSRLLLEFMVIMPDQEAIARKLRTFKSTLKAISQDNDTLIMEKMVSVMEMVENEAIDKKTKAGVSAESHVDEFIDRFFEIVLHLENIIAFPSLPIPIKLMEGSVSALESGLEQCSAQVKEVEGKVNELKKLISCDYESEKLTSLELRIVAMWDQVKTVEYCYPLQLFLKM